MTSPVTPTVPEPLVTVYVLNHNYGRFIRQAVESVLAQDYSALEILVIDDASDDCSPEALAEFERNPRVRVLRQAESRGLTACCNTALRESAGEFVMRLDADDYLETFAVRKLVAAIAGEPHAALVFGDYVEVDGRGATIRRVKRHDFNALQAMSDLPAHGACTMVRRSFLEDVGGYDETVSCQDGLDLWLHVDPQHSVLHIGESLFCYRQHGGNLTRDESRLSRARAALMAKHVAKRGVLRPKVIGIVPVRGQVADPGSMAMRNLGGRPLVDWTIDEALSCEGINRVVVSSPDESVLEHVHERYGSRVGVHRRALDWAGLNVDVATTVSHVLDTEAAEDRFYDAQMILTAESPFRSAVYIQQAIDVMLLFGADGVVGVRRSDEMFYLHNGLGLQPVREDERLRLERDDLYRECGGMHLVRSRSGRSGGRLGHVLLDEIAASAIRTELDWKTAELLAAERDCGVSG